MKLRFLFLSNKKQTSILKFLNERGDVSWTKEKISKNYVTDFDWIISYGYRHIIREDVLENCKNKIINLHISYLPYNRGAHPNYWSFKDNTPKGVSIHVIDRGIDTGPVFIQKECFFTEEDTLSSTYLKLKNEIEILFFANFDKIVSGELDPKNQENPGTFHKKSDLPEKIDWNIKIKNI